MRVYVSQVCGSFMPQTSGRRELSHTSPNPAFTPKSITSLFRSRVIRLDGFLSLHISLRRMQCLFFFYQCVIACYDACIAALQSLNACLCFSEINNRDNPCLSSVCRVGCGAVSHVSHVCIYPGPQSPDRLKLSSLEELSASTVVH